MERPQAVKKIPRKFFRYGLACELVKQKLKRFSPDIILVTSGMTYWYVGVQKTIKILREFFSDCPIILGGVYATLCPAHAKSYSGVDVIFEGADIQALILLIKKILGINFEIDESIQLMPYVELLSSKQALPVLAHSGCPFHCTYCAVHKLSSRTNKTPDEIISYIQYCIKNFRSSDFAFYDDALLANANNFIIPFLKEIIKKRIKVRFHTPNGLHARFVTEEIGRLLFRANFKTIRLALETTDLTWQKKVIARLVMNN